MLCTYCSEKIPEKRLKRHSKTCSNTCRKKRDSLAYLAYNPKRDQNRRGATGAASEMTVCSDLLRRGYHVFRSVAPDGICDILILREDGILRVEVKTGYRNKDGSVMWPKITKQIGCHDVLAVVVLGEIHYKPELI